MAQKNHLWNWPQVTKKDNTLETKDMDICQQWAAMGWCVRDHIWLSCWWQQCVIKTINFFGAIGGRLSNFHWEQHEESTTHDNMAFIGIFYWIVLLLRYFQLLIWLTICLYGNGNRAMTLLIIQLMGNWMTVWYNDMFWSRLHWCGTVYIPIILCQLVPKHQKQIINMTVWLYYDYTHRRSAFLKCLPPDLPLPFASPTVVPQLEALIWWPWESGEPQLSRWTRWTAVNHRDPVVTRKYLDERSSNGW